MIRLADQYCGNFGYGGCPHSGHFPGWALLWQLPLAIVVFALAGWGVSAFKRMAREEAADAARRRWRHEHPEAARETWRDQP